MAEIVFTSGTTALSKAVMLSQKNIVSNINDMNRVERMYETDTNIAFLPFHHTFGSTGILLFLSKGARNVFCDGLRHVQENQYLFAYHFYLKQCTKRYKQESKKKEKQN